MKEKRGLKARVLISALTAVFMIVVTLFCTMSGPTSASATDPNYQDGTTFYENEFYLGAWCEPPSTNADFTAFKDVGFNVMYLGNKRPYNSISLKYYLEKCEENGIKTVVSPGNNQSNPISIRLANKNIFNFNDFPAFYGYLACDEPQAGTAAIPANASRGIHKAFTGIYDYLLDEYEFFNAEYPGKQFETVVCVGRNEGEFGYDALNKYSEKVISQMTDKVMSTDRYPYKVKDNESVCLSDFYTWCIQQHRLKANQYGVDKNIMYYQTWFPPAFREFISAQEITYQLYTSMVYGMNGFVAFKYEPYYNNFNEVETSMKDLYGQQTEVAYYTKTALAEIKKFDYIYLPFTKDWQGAMFVEGSANTRTDSNRVGTDPDMDFMDSYAGVTDITATQDTLIGVMKDGDGRDGFMVSNQSYSLDRLTDSVTMKFSGKTRAMVVIKGESEIVNLDNGTLTFDVVPGGGVFVIPLV